MVPFDVSRAPLHNWRFKRTVPTKGCTGSHSAQAIGFGCCNSTIWAATSAPVHCGRGVAALGGLELSSEQGTECSVVMRHILDTSGLEPL
jgi:hypothetical protein